MKSNILIFFLIACSSLFAADSNQLKNDIQELEERTNALQQQLARLHKRLADERVSSKKIVGPVTITSVSVVPSPTNTKKGFRSSSLSVHTLAKNPESTSFYPTALIAEDRVITYIAGTPVVTSPYLGDRPAFDGSDYIVNISSINRDIRLMQQRRRLYRAYESIGYPVPQVPIIALSGKTEPVGIINDPYVGRTVTDFNLGSSELDVAAILNDTVEAFMSIAYDATPPAVGPRVSNSAFNLNMGFVNIGNLDRSPFYFTAGQLYVPFGRYASAMVSPPLTLGVARTKARPFIIGYKSQEDFGPYVAAYGFKSDTGLGHSGIGGINVGYIIKTGELSGDVGGGYISSITDAAGMQDTGSIPFATFGGFGSGTNGSELIRKVPGVNLHGNISFDRYNLTAEWVGAANSFRFQDLSFVTAGAKPQAGQLEAGVTFMAFSKPASVAVGYQWTKDALALNLPKHRVGGVFNISIWKDTVESLEYRHDVDYGTTQYANGASAPGLVNQNTIGTGKSVDAVLAQIGVYF